MSQAFPVTDEGIDRYDAWYDSPKGRMLLATELECIRPLLEQFPRPYLEVGVGTGRFAEALDIEWGIDLSPRFVGKARRRAVEAVLGTGENIPFEDTCFGGVLVAFTLCFVSDPCEVMQEIRRILTPGGGLVLGLLLKGTPWADYYARQGTEGHPWYSAAHFHSKDEVEELVEQAGFLISAFRSTLFQRPGLERYEEEQPVEGYVPGAGFVGIAAASGNSPYLRAHG